MLQRAASNACSWWWASHIRTKQSKWLEQSLQDMEEKVHSMLKLIEEDGDSFAKRAEMYYKRRPELISSVEDTYRAFKALADRYDLLSKELQNANNTIATVFPEQVQFAYEDDDCPTPKLPKNSHGSNKGNVPKVPKAPIENLKGIISTAKKSFKTKKSSKPKTRNKTAAKSGMNKDDALVEIDKLHKEILTLQTVKEFVQSSYENGLAKYWEIENQIMELQDKVCRLQDEYDVETVIEDNEARTLMAEAALKSCEETLSALQEKQEKSTREAKEEFKKIEDARQLLKSLRRECMEEETDEQKSGAKAGDGSKSLDRDVSDLINEAKEIEKTDKSLDLSSMGSLTVTELAEKIDELVNKVINLETAVSSQTVLINTLRTEADDLHAQIKNLEDEKETLIGDTHNLSSRVKEMEERLNRIEDLNKNVESQNSDLQTDFDEARSSLDLLSEKLSSVKPDEEVEETSSSEKQSSVKPDKEVKETSSSKKHKRDKEVKETSSSKKHSGKRDKEVDKTSSSKKLSSVKPEKEVKETSSSKKLSSSKPDKEVEKTSLLEKLSSVKPDKEAEKTSSLEKLSSVKPDKEIKETSPSQVEVRPLSENKLPEEIKDKKDVQCPGDGEKSSIPAKTEETEDVKEVGVDVQVLEPSVPKEEEVKKPVKKSVTFLDEKPKELAPVDHHDEPVKKGEAQEAKVKEDDLSWQQMLLSGTEDREKILLKEYTTILRNYKDVKKRLSNAEKKEKESKFDVTVQMRELKEVIFKRDQEIVQLRRKLSLLHRNKDMKEESSLATNSSGDQTVQPEDLEAYEDVNVPDINKEDEIKLVYTENDPTISAVEEKLRLAIDAILDENLDFWLRFSTSFHQVQKFKSEVQDLQDEISKLKEKKKQEGSVSAQQKSEVRPIYKHLREIQTELTVWLEHSVSLKEELKRRSASLCCIQEEITTALKEGVEEEEISFSSHQAAKLQGEILNMKQENTKVKEELQACLDHVSILQLDIEKTLKNLNVEFGIATDQPQLQHTMSRSKVPLRSFIFGTKPKKPKHSLFSFMHPNRKFHVVRPGLPLTDR